MFLRTLKYLGKLSLQQVPIRADHYTHAQASKHTHRRSNTGLSFFTVINGDKQSEVKNNSTNTNFKRITTSADIQEFAGNIVAYISDLPYFSNENDAITSPFEMSGKKIRFAILTNKVSRWKGDEFGYNMDCFLKPNSAHTNHALIDSRIEHDSTLSMRLATIQELEFLKLSLVGNQAECINQKNILQMLDKKIGQATADSTEQVFRNRR